MSLLLGLSQQRVGVLGRCSGTGLISEEICEDCLVRCDQQNLSLLLSVQMLKDGLLLANYVPDGRVHVLLG